MITARPCFAAPAAFPVLQAGPVAKCPYRRTPTRCSASESSTTSDRTIAEKVAARLRAELPVLFDAACEDHYALYSPTVEFSDPLSRFRGVGPYRANIAFLRDSPVFKDTGLDIFDVAVRSPTLVRTRWALAMTAQIPWRPRVAFTGTSDYELDADGNIVRHVDIWDSLADSAYFAPAAVKDLLGQAAPGRGSKTKSPSGRLLRRDAVLEIREYPPGTLARVSDGGDGCILSAKKMADGGEASEEPVLSSPDFVAVVVLKLGTDPTSERARLLNIVTGAGYATPTRDAFIVTYRPGVNSRALSRELWVCVTDVDLSADK